jgi:hypothetical protein
MPTVAPSRGVVCVVDDSGGCNTTGVYAADAGAMDAAVHYTQWVRRTAHSKLLSV